EAANLGEAERPAVSRLDERGQEPAERVGQAAAPAAHAPRPVVDDLDVGQLAGQAARPAVQLSIEDESSPEALGDLDVQETADALAGTEGRLAEGAEVGVVVGDDRDAQRGAHGCGRV